MPEIKDLATIGYETENPRVLSVGYLGLDMPFTQGKVSLKVKEKLGTMLKVWWYPAVSVGSHQCEFCHGFHDSGELLVPANGFVYQSPTMIGHYIESHNYSPPLEFQKAVLQSPMPGTEEYKKLLFESSPDWISEWVYYDH